MCIICYHIFLSEYVESLSKTSSDLRERSGRREEVRSWSNRKGSTFLSKSVGLVLSRSYYRDCTLPRRTPATFLWIRGKDSGPFSPWINASERSCIYPDHFHLLGEGERGMTDYGFCGRIQYHSVSLHVFVSVCKHFLRLKLSRVVWSFEIHPQG